MDYSVAADELILKIKELDFEDKVEAINNIKLKLKAVSPFAFEPVDCVIWAKGSEVEANDYNPNNVAPPEMMLLETSIIEDGYTQPIVAWQKDDEGFEVVDGFHRNRVGKESDIVGGRVHGYLPLSVINAGKTKKEDRIASTIRHNRARGKHSVDSMTDIVVELKKRNWTDAKISKHLGMDEDEINRLSQISGLVSMFIDTDFTKAWDIGNGDELGEEVIADD